MRVNRDILFVSANFPPVIGGSSVVYDYLCRSCAKQVVALGSYCCGDTGELRPGVAEHDASCGYIMYRVRHLRAPSNTKRIGAFGRWRGLLLDDLPVMSITLAKIVQIVMRHRIKVVCLGELVSAGWLVFPLRYLLGRKVVIYTHGEEVSREEEGAMANLRGTFLRHCHGIVAVSLFCKSAIVSRYGIDPSIISVVANGVDLDVFNLGRRDRAALPPSIRGKKIILSASRLVERKGQDRLIQAMPQILEAIPDAHCVIVGEGPLEGQLRRVASAAGVDAMVTFLGRVPLEHLAQLYRSVDLFVLPCHTLGNGDTEGFGLVFLEANACGTPVVAGAAGGTVEAVIDGETGLIVDGASPGEIASAVIRVLNDPALARQLGRGGWLRAQQRGWRQVAEEFRSVCAMPGMRGLAPSYSRPEPIANVQGASAMAAAAIPHLLVTVDVEEQFDWSRFSRSEHKVAGLDALVSFHDDCKSIGIKPVLLATYPLLADDDFRTFFTSVLADDSGEVGIHLHSWVTPPFWDHPNVFNSYQMNLPEHIERRKLETLCRFFEDRFGRAPAAHRAGRWGGSDRTFCLLEEQGVSIDLSPSTGIGHCSQGGPNSAALDGRPFWGGASRRVLVVPAPAIKCLRGPDWVSSAYFGGARRLPVLRRFQGWTDQGTPVRFSPEVQSSRLLAAMAQQFALRQLPVAVYSLHSTSLYLGGSQYADTPARAREVRDRAIGVLRHSVTSQVLRPSTCRDIYAEAYRTRALSQASSPGDVAAAGAVADPVL